MNIQLMTIDELLDDRSVDEKAHGQILEMIHHFGRCFSQNVDTIDTPGAPTTTSQDVLEKAQEALSLISRANIHCYAKDYSAMLEALHAAEQAIWGMNEIARAG